MQCKSHSWLLTEATLLPARPQGCLSAALKTYLVIHIPFWAPQLHGTPSSEKACFSDGSTIRHTFPLASITKGTASLRR